MMSAHAPIWHLCGLSNGLQALVLHCCRWMHIWQGGPDLVSVLHLQSLEGLAILLCQSCHPKGAPWTLDMGFALPCRR